MASRFSIRVKELRKEKGLSQSEIAKRYDLDRTSIGKWETNISVPDIGIIKDLAEYFEVTTDYLLGISDIRDPYEIQTIAAGHDDEEWTEEELAAIEQFKAFVRSQKRKGKE